VFFYRYRLGIIASVRFMITSEKLAEGLLDHRFVGHPRNTYIPWVLYNVRGELGDRPLVGLPAGICEPYRSAFRDLGFSVKVEFIKDGHCARVLRILEI